MMVLIVGGALAVVAVAALAGLVAFAFFANRAIGQSFERSAERTAAAAIGAGGGALGQERDVRAVETTFASRRWLRADLLLVTDAMYAFCRTPLGMGQPSLVFVPIVRPDAPSGLDTVTLCLEAAYCDSGRLILIGSNRFARRKLALDVTNPMEWHARIRAAGFELAAGRFRAPRSWKLQHYWFAGFGLVFVLMIGSMLLLMFLNASP